MLPMGPMAPLSLPVPLLLLSSVVAFTLVAPACESRSAQASGPFAVERPETDFGRLFEGEVFEHEWELVVQRPVALSASKTDCGCTLARIERGGPAGREPYELEQPLQAGESLFVSISYDTRGRRGPASRAVTLTTTSGELCVLRFAANVEPWLRVEPQTLEFARVPEGEGVQREFAVRSESGQPFGLTASGRALAPWVRVELEPVEPDASGRAPLWKGRAVLDGTAPMGTYSYPIELLSDVPIDSDAAVEGVRADGVPRMHSSTPSWTLQVAGALALSAPALNFGLVRANETVSRSVRLESLRPELVLDSVQARLEPLQPAEPFLLAKTAQVRTRPVGGACEIELVLAGLDPGVKGNFKARLVVETGHSEVPRLEALVHGVRAPDGGAQQ